MKLIKRTRQSIIPSTNMFDLCSFTDRFADVELDALHSAIQALNARLKRFYQSSSPASATLRSQKNVSDSQLSQIKSSLEMLSLLNKENSKKVKLIEHGLKSHEK